MIEDDAPTPFQTGAIIGGRSAVSTLFEGIDARLVRFWSKELAANFEPLRETEAGINVVFQISGEFHQADDFVVRTGSFLKKLRIQIVQVCIPDDVRSSDDVRRAIVNALLECGPEVVAHFHRRKIGLSLDRSLFCLAETVAFLEWQLANPEPPRSIEP